MQIGSPTFADDVVAQAHVLLKAGASGIFNCVGSGNAASRLDYVKSVLDAGCSSTRVVPVTFTRRAPVSPNESALNARLHHLGLDSMPSWRASLAKFVTSLMSADTPVIQDPKGS
jgi:dTDP-4-dehydrorhamnose reductase